MRTGPAVHGVLLAAALGVGWMTWTRDKTVAPATATLTVWPESGAVESLALHGPLRDLTIEKKADGGDYYWASLTKTTPPPTKPAAPDGGVAMSVLEDKGTTTKQEFPVGDEGEKTLGRFAPLKALRDLGVKTSKEEYGFGDDSDKLTVKIGGKTHELTLGARVFGGDDRYVLDPASGHVFVVAGEVARPFDAPEFSLRERKLHGFQPGDVGEATVRAADKEKKLLHVAKAPPAEGAAPPARPTGAMSWADAKTPDKPDQTLANFMDRIEALAPMEYGQKPEGLTTVGAIEYRGKDGKVLGSVELSKKPAEKAGQFDYYVKTEKTHGLAKVSTAAGTRVDQDLAQVLQ